MLPNINTIKKKKKNLRELTCTGEAGGGVCVVLSLTLETDSGTGADGTPTGTHVSTCREGESPTYLGNRSYIIEMMHSYSLPM